MAAEVLAEAGFATTVYDHMGSVGRKLLVAGRGGLNLTHSEPLETLLGRYRPAEPRLLDAVRAFGPDSLRAWCAGLGEEPFVGSSGRVFPASLRATPLLRAWLRRLASIGVQVQTRHRWLGWAPATAGPLDTSPALRFGLADGSTLEVRSDVTVLALGGASWPRVGSDGGWVPLLRAVGVTVSELRPANCGVKVTWTPELVRRFDRVPLKNVAVTASGSTVRGDLMIASDGLEGGPVYAHTATLRDQLDRNGSAQLHIDLHPDLAVERLAARLAHRRPKESLATYLRRTTGLPPVALSVLRDATANQLPDDPEALARIIKALPLTVTDTMGIERAISSAGGVAWSEVDEHLMLRARPGTFVAGEMLDWEAPTGGYLLQATLATAVAAARGAEQWALSQGYDEIDGGDTIWRIERTFLSSRWTCIWGRGCHGIGPERDAPLALGCCSLGAELDGIDEALNIAALAATLPPEVLQHHAEAAHGVFSDETRSNTAVVDGACIFLNRPGFAGGAGCALHLAALQAGESPIDWKPSVCWQLPIKVDWEMRDDDVEVATVRGWTRADWGSDGETMAWCCTEEPEAHVGDRPVIESLAEELAAVMGEAVYVELRRRYDS